MWVWAVHTQYSMRVNPGYTHPATDGYKHYPHMLKTLWASIEGDPVFMRRVNGWLTIFWLLMIPVSVATGWINSVQYVSALSLWALVSGHWSAWQAARVEVKQDDQNVGHEVTQALIERTTIEPS